MRPLPVTVLLLSAAAMGPGCKSTTPPPAPAAPVIREDGTRESLQPVSAFSGITDPEARSIALFVEAGRVITHPRCTNCHPPDGVPRLGLEQRVHVPRVVGGSDGHGAPGLPCTSCHQATHTPLVGDSLQGIPGNPRWALAPVELAWIGRSLGQICEQIKDPRRNGGHDLKALHHHMAEDALVGWGWDPGPGREPVPGSQKAFGELIQAWIDTGAACPKP